LDEEREALRRETERQAFTQLEKARVWFDLIDGLYLNKTEWKNESKLKSFDLALKKKSEFVNKSIKFTWCKQ